MTGFAGKARLLPYPLDRAVSLGAITDDETACGIPVFPDSADERIPVIFMLSRDEFVALASCIDVGSDLAYGEEAVKMWKIWTDNVMCADFCDLTADCIETSDAVEAALAARIATSELIQAALAQTFNPDVAGGTATAEYRAQNQAPGDMACDNDISWGRIRTGLVDRSFQRIVDVLEEIDLTTDNQEMLAKTLDAIPVLGEALGIIGVSAWLAWFDNVRGFLKDAFDAGDTLETRDRIACDLWCIYLRDCSLSFEQISQYFYQRAVTAFPSWETAFADIGTLITAMGNPTELVGDAVVDVLLASEYGFQSFVNDWFGAKIGTCGGDMLFGAANEGWMTACEECPPEEWDFVIDFVTGENVDFVTIPQGDYEPGVGVHSVFQDVGGGYQLLGVNWSTLSGSVLATASIEADYTAGTLVSSGDATFYLRWSTGSPQIIVTTPTEPVFPEEWSGSAAGGLTGELGIQIMAGVGSSPGVDPGGSALLTRIALHGTGTIPG